MLIGQTNSWSHIFAIFQLIICNSLHQASCEVQQAGQMSGGWVCACSSCSPVPVSSLLSLLHPPQALFCPSPGFDQLPLLAPHIQHLRWGLSLVSPSRVGERRAMKETLQSCSNSSSVSLSSSSHVPCMPSSSSSSSSKSSNPNSRPLAFARAGEDGPSHVTC